MRAIRSRRAIVIFLALVPILAVTGWRWPAWLADLPSPLGPHGRAETIAGSGYLEVPQVRVASLVPGIVVRLGVREAQLVHPGDELLVLSHPALEASLRSAEAAWKLAEGRLADLRAAAPTGTVVMSPELRLAEMEQREASAALRLAQVRCDELILRAPLTATVGAVLTRVGEQILPGQTLIRLSRLSELALVIYVPQSRLGEVAMGQAATVTSAAAPKKRYAAAVTNIATMPEFTPRNVQTADERASLVYAVRLTLQDPGRELRPGMTATAEIEVREP